MSSMSEAQVLCARVDHLVLVGFIRRGRSQVSEPEGIELVRRWVVRGVGVCCENVRRDEGPTREEGAVGEGEISQYLPIKRDCFRIQKCRLEEGVYVNETKTTHPD